MNIEQMEYIVTVANAGSLSKAAEELHISLSAISQSISKLENEIGLKLFVRNRAGAALTSQGEYIVGKAREVLVKVEELRDEVNCQLDMLSGELKIATIPGPIHLLVDVVSRFKKAYPDVKLDIYENGPVKIIEEVYQKQLDLGLILISDRLINKHHMLAFEKVREGKMVVGVRKESPLAKKKTIRPEDLIHETIVLYDDAYIEQYVSETLSKYGSPDVLFTTNNTDAIKSAVKRGIAITLGIDYSFGNMQLRERDIVVVEIEEGDHENVYLALVRHREGQANRIRKEFVSSIKKYF
ncbi:LysR family transcriptional regulator [Bacillus sp. RAR_GA_16]|uniref:LysR family transcriptional regulator n=1 Tax=Bacillus sp. RAR_GA_16 TaxID=2876774 RepID=UPI001CCDCA5B|nr:LysR family transcriptional regulator [Bacillus sp. RAR_GA_16]MCA0173673.1 LysR family transcriptional regulator [Bacillus sp. RAR_GA_16]